MYYYSVTEALRDWPADSSNSGWQPAGNAMAKALRALGITENPLSPLSNVSIRTQPSDGYNVSVKSEDAERYAKELWKDPRVVEVKIDGKDFPKPTEKTAEDVQKEFDAFKKKVIEVALRTKREEEWCNSGFEAAMKELGLEVPSQKARVVLEIDLSGEDAEYNPDDFFSIKRFVQESDSYCIADTIKSVEPIKD